MRRIALGVALIGLACTKTPGQGQASPEPLNRQSADAGSPWQARCAHWLEDALQLAAQKEPGLRGAWVERERPVSADGMLREAVAIDVSPPVCCLGGLYIRVKRTQPAPAPQPGDGSWQRQGDTLGAIHLKGAGNVGAGIVFDGWRSEQVEQLAPIFEGAIDHCFAD